MRERCRWLLCWIALFAGAAAAAGTATQSHEEGRRIYNQRCYFCHGYSGDARTLAAAYLAPPPADFTRADPSRLTAPAIVGVLENGRAGTAMKSFAGILNQAQISRVAEFVATEFIERKAVNTRYHTAENGWIDHARYRIAFPFATGEVPLSRPWESLSPAQAQGRRLYFAVCVSCHDRGAPEEGALGWTARPAAYSRNSQAGAPQPDAATGAGEYGKGGVPKKIRGLTRQEKRGARLFLANCAACHGADGSGRNWIGKFLEPHPRDLSDPGVMAGMSWQRLIGTIREGIPESAMPAWKSVLDDAQILAIAAYVNRAFHRLARD